METSITGGTEAEVDLFSTIEVAAAVTVVAVEAAPKSYKSLASIMRLEEEEGEEVEGELDPSPLLLCR